MSETPEREPAFSESAGVKLSESTVFRPSVELSTGYQPNVFFEDGSATEPANGSAIMRIGVGAIFSTMPAQRLAAEAPPGQSQGPKLAFSGDLNVTRHQYLSTNDNVSKQSDFGVSALIDVALNPEGAFTLVLRDAFNRAVRPPPAETGQSMDRDRNELVAGFILKPGGGAIQVYGNYAFGADIFERSDLSFANRLSHTFSLGGRWQWLPKTQFNFESSFGVIVVKEEAFKMGSSTPLRIMIGTSTLITPTFGTVLKLGYGNGYYDQGPSFSSYLALLEGRLALGPTVRLAFGYSHDFADSLIGNYYADHSLYTRAVLQVGDRVQLRGKGEVRFRGYGGIPAQDEMDGRTYQFCGNSACTSSERSDVMTKIEAGADVQVNAWMTAGASYVLSGQSSDFFLREIAGNTTNDTVSYVWQEFLVRAVAKF
ncbi:MAG: hypothetical protein HY698_02120 [Deltaproteobacteria bacterium]|nr:hypothetical protein [Deltaproteobacteria bacterium]